MTVISDDAGEFRDPAEPLVDHAVQSLPGNALFAGEIGQMQRRIADLFLKESEDPVIQGGHEADDLNQFGAGVMALLRFFGRRGSPHATGGFALDEELETLRSRSVFGI